MRSFPNVLMVAALAGCASVRLPAALPEQMVNVVGMTMVLVPAGDFLMGSEETPQGQQTRVNALVKRVMRYCLWRTQRGVA